MKDQKATIYTIGSSGKTAEDIFEKLKAHGIRRLLDVRLRNDSHLLGFTRRAHLPYLLREICGAEYQHEPDLAPSAELLDAWSSKTISWATYERRFVPLLEQRKVVAKFSRAYFATPTALLCSEPKASQCHRRLVAEHLATRYPELQVVHL
jgi:uncharacterized protein (DUF488 family)